MNKSQKEYRNRMTKNGLITLTVAVVLLLALILINFACSVLPADIREMDMTENHLYSVSDNTKRIVSKTAIPVDIYLTAAGGESALSSDGVQLDAFLDKLAAVSGKVSYSIIDTSIRTDYITELNLNTESVADLSVIVKSPLRTRIINGSDFFQLYIDEVGKVDQTTAMYYYYYYGMSPYYVFDGEALMLNAINYVTGTDLPTVYLLTGHSEAALSTELSEQLDVGNITVNSINLAKLSSVPEDCDMLIINTPKSDVSNSEATALLHYMNNGGTIMLFTSPTVGTLPNLEKISTAMGLSAEQGLVIETDSTRYYSASAPYSFIPSLTSHDIFDGVSRVIVPVSHGIGISESLPDGVSVTQLFTSSAGSYLLPADAEKLQKPEGAESRAFCVGAVAQKTNGAKLIWFAIDGEAFMSSSANQVVGGGNHTAFLNAVHWICGESNLPTTELIPLNTNPLTVSETSSGLLSVILTIVLPLICIGFGMFCIIRRKKR